MRQLVFLGVTLALTVGCGSSDTGQGQSNQNGGGATSTGGNASGAGGGSSIGGAAQGGSSGSSSGGSAGKMGTQCSETTGCPQPGCQGCPGYVCQNGYCVPEGNFGTGGAMGSGGASGALKWFSTCGPPVCQVPGAGGASSGVAACTSDQKEGASCTVADQECDTGASCSGPLKCAASDPTNGGQCPKSRAKYKTDIEYLSPAERAKLAQDVQSIPLVRYRYKDGPERQHLGFIIEDVEPSPSVDSANDRVDLYGYTSMAIAALQEQRREIESLKDEVRELRGELAKRKH